jgi:hypothetical protein
MAAIFRNVPENTPSTAPKVSDANLGHLTSYARIAIHIGEFSLHNPVWLKSDVIKLRKAPKLG